MFDQMLETVLKMPFWSRCRIAAGILAGVRPNGHAKLSDQTGD